MGNFNLKNKFSIGFTCHDMSLEQFKELALKYSYYINDIYFSPPYGKKFHTRSRIHQTLQPTLKVERAVFDCLNELAEKGFKLTLALNTHTPTVEEVGAAAERVCEQLPITSITTLVKFMNTLQSRLPDIIYKCSFNQGVKTFQEAQRICDSNMFDYIALGSSAIRERKLWQLFNENGVKVIHMLNNGCSLRCRHYCAPPAPPRCKKQFIETLEKPDVNMEQLYAEQSIMPWELHEYLIPEKNICRFKISTRPFSYTNFDLCFNSYIENLNRELVTNNPGKWHLWARLGHLNQFEKFDYERICDYKKKLWCGIKKDTYQQFGSYKK